MILRRSIFAFVFVSFLVPLRTAVAAFDCMIEPRRIVEIGSPVAGTIERITVDRGDRVAEGDLLVVMESHIERANVALARARAEQEARLLYDRARREFGERKYRRTVDLSRKRFASDTDVDEAKTEMVLAGLSLQETKEKRRIARLELERARAALAKREIHSPLSAVVVERYHSPGERVESGPILRLADIDTLNIETLLPSEWLGRVREGDTATVLPEFPVGERLRARVVIVDEVVDAASGLFGVRLRLDNAGHRIHAGLKCRVEFGTRGD